MLTTVNSADNDNVSLTDVTSSQSCSLLLRLSMSFPIRWVYSVRLFSPLTAACRLSRFYWRSFALIAVGCRRDCDCIAYARRRMDWQVGRRLSRKRQNRIVLCIIHVWADVVTAKAVNWYVLQVRCRRDLSVERFLSWKFYKWVLAVEATRRRLDLWSLRKTRKLNSMDGWVVTHTLQDVASLEYDIENRNVFTMEDE